MNKGKIFKFITIALLLFFIFICFVTLLDELLSGFLTNPGEWKPFIFTTIDFTLGIFSLVGVWRMKKWAYIPLIALTAFGLILSIIYPPTNITGGIFNKMSNLPFSLYTGTVTLILFWFALRTIPSMSKNSGPNNK